MSDSLSSSRFDHDLDRVRILRLRAVAQGMATGIVSAICVFTATMWLVVKGGDRVGPHLSLLGQYFIGYSVSFWGAWIGAAYVLVLGFTGGYLVARIYNALIDSSGRKSS